MRPGHVCAVLALLLCASACGSQAFSHISLGDMLLRNYKQYISLPISTIEAKGQGWRQTNSSCNPWLGIPYNIDPSGPLRNSPVTLYFTPAGQVTGIAVRIFGDVKQNLVNLGYFTYVRDGEYDISVTFRDTPNVCSSSTSALTLGDRLVINADTLAEEIPLTTAEAERANWSKGACFFSMGYHYFKDLSSGPRMSWESANMLPIVPMYNNGTINAFFFASTDIQQQLTTANYWDGIALPNFLMCKNWCDKACTFGDTHFWSTMHIYMNDYKQATCANDCQVSCCP
eukprot:m.53244 g.53244  ORF g.53244 m.53244 type:complete len:286 (+) comp13142_c0_seq1:63-920(+)